MGENQTCPRCGTKLDEANADGLCPRCLIGLNLSSPTEAPTGYDEDASGAGRGKQKLVNAPSLAEMAVFFPELEILELLGRGGMGAVYKARQLSLDRIVALKILPPAVNHDQAFADRFTREAQALARLNHRHIVTLYEFGRKDGLFYFLMEYVDGVNLRGLINTSRLSPGEALAIVPQICEALEYAHERGIVHRDIKPENLLLNRKGEIKVADFGVAKIVGGNIENPGNLSPKTAGSVTEAKGVVGTPSYMAPEQLSSPLGVDHRADIYSLGVVFYQLLTGELPTGKFEPPSNKVIIDVRLDQVVLRALEKQPEQRYQKVSEVKKDLETIQATAHEPRGEVSAEPAPPLARRKKTILQSIGALLAALTISGIVYWFGFSKVHSLRTFNSRKNGNWYNLASADLLQGRSSSTAVWTDKKMIVFGGEGLNVTFGDGAQYDLDENIWTPLFLQGAAPSSRTCASAVWTGSAMIVWGGFGGSDAEDINRNDGAKYYPGQNVWRLVAIKGAPTARFAHSALWTGKEMLIWGGFGGSRTQLHERRSDGYLNTGGRYNPADDSWAEISLQGAPSKRVYPAVVWTGKEMIVWGGANSIQILHDGARYDPRLDVWKPMNNQNAPDGRMLAQTVWTGKEMLVWSGCTSETNGICTYFSDGKKYNPETDVWTQMSPSGAPKGSIITDAVWTGTEMIVWGGVNDTGTAGVHDRSRYLGTGGRYNPVTDRWIEIPKKDSPAPRAASAMVWTGKGLLVFGGFNGKHLNDAYLLLPAKVE